uniref:Uncharacterized protein n=1 Tax=Hyaloperonospora arabidopsidis (strain Emoy2) TaxID=559515 RepID=M4B902_HYAAE
MYSDPQAELRGRLSFSVHTPSASHNGSRTSTLSHSQPGSRDGPTTISSGKLSRAKLKQIGSLSATVGNTHGARAVQRQVRERVQHKIEDVGGQVEGGMKRRGSYGEMIPSTRGDITPCVPDRRSTSSSPSRGNVAHQSIFSPLFAPRLSSSTSSLAYGDELVLSHDEVLSGEAKMSPREGMDDTDVFAEISCKAALASPATIDSAEEKRSKLDIVGLTDSGSFPPFPISRDASDLRAGLDNNVDDTVDKAAIGTASNVKPLTRAKRKDLLKVHLGATLIVSPLAVGSNKARPGTSYSSSEEDGSEDQEKKT